MVLKTAELGVLEEDVRGRGARGVRGFCLADSSVQVMLRRTFEGFELAPLTVISESKCERVG
jgi:hypothetical protein